MVPNEKDLIDLGLLSKISSSLGGSSDDNSPGALAQKSCQPGKKIYPDYKVVPWKYLVVLEILRWCWKVKKLVLRHSKMGRGEHRWRYMFSKLPKTITLVRKRWFFSKVLRIQDGQEYLSIRIVLWFQYQVIFHTILYSLVTITFHY